MSVHLTWEAANKPPANLVVKLSINSEPEKKFSFQFPPARNIFGKSLQSKHWAPLKYFEGWIMLQIVANKIFLFFLNHGNGLEQLSIPANRFIMGWHGISMSKNEKWGKVLKKLWIYETSLARYCHVSPFQTILPMTLDKSLICVNLVLDLAPVQNSARTNFQIIVNEFSHIWWYICHNTSEDIS